YATAGKSGWASSTWSTRTPRTPGRGRSGSPKSSKRESKPNALARLPKPLRDDRLVAGRHRRAVVQGVVVRRAVALQVVPQHRHAGLRRNRQADVHERRVAARLDLVEIDHEGPRALPERGGRVALQLVGLEIVGVGLELLRDLVVLPLARLGHLRIDAHRAADALIQCAYRGFAARKVAGAAGP